MSVVLLSEDAIKRSLPEIIEKCGAPIKIKPYYFAVLVEKDEKIIAWLEERDFGVVCLVREKEPTDKCQTDSDCSDYDDSTTDECKGTPKACVHTKIVSCISGDNYCPSTCSHQNDSDCRALTCSEQGGEICSALQECKGTIIEASDTNECCTGCGEKETTEQLQCTDNDGKCPDNCDAGNDNDCQAPGRETIREGESLYNLKAWNNYAGTNARILLKRVSQIGSTESYTAEFELYDFQDRLVGSKTVSENANLKEELLDGDSKQVLFDNVVVKKISIGVHSGVPYAEISIEEVDDGVERYIEGDNIGGLRDEEGNQIILKVRVSMVGTSTISAELDEYMESEAVGSCSGTSRSQLSCTIALDHKISVERVAVAANSGVGYLEITREKRGCENNDDFCPAECSATNDNDCKAAMVGEAEIEYYGVDSRKDYPEGGKIYMTGASGEIKLSVSSVYPTMAKLTAYQNNELIERCECHASYPKYICENVLHSSNRLYCHNTYFVEEELRGYMDASVITKKTDAIQEGQQIEGLFSSTSGKTYKAKLVKVSQISATAYSVTLNLLDENGNVAATATLTEGEETRFADSADNDILDNPIKVISISVG
jgi:hypothetical protein